MTHESRFKLDKTHIIFILLMCSKQRENIAINFTVWYEHVTQFDKPAIS